jgi:hypothetical protein
MSARTIAKRFDATGLNGPRLSGTPHFISPGTTAFERLGRIGRILLLKHPRYESLRFILIGKATVKRTPLDINVEFYPIRFIKNNRFPKSKNLTMGILVALINRRQK